MRERLLEVAYLCTVPWTAFVKRSRIIMQLKFTLLEAGRGNLLGQIEPEEIERSNFHYTM